ncbi:winged helix-turn-helix domain-containing protein [Streptosporangium sp. KLBMP 9127]|nr:helix-turn-helix domain-containing protein [Streptosporangium sp. KLBMP 9127]
MTRKSFSARTLDAKALKSFAHPLRLRLYELLDEHGPSTATQLAARVHENTGATSYHLRELARHGMIEPVPELGRGKEKFWRITPGGFAFGSPPDSDPETASAVEFLIADVIRQRGAELARWQEEEGSTPEEWVRASGLTRRSLRLTAEELTSLSHQVHEVLAVYRELSDRRERESAGDPDPATAKVVIHFDTFPVGRRNAPEKGPQG